MLHGDRVMARRIGVDRRGRPEGTIVEVLERANRDVVGRVCTKSTASGSWSPRTAHQPGHPGRRRTSAATAKPGRWWCVEIIAAAVAARAADGAHRRGAGQLRRSRHGDRDRAAQARSAARILRRGASKQAAASARRGAAGRSQGPRGPARAAAGHHRRRDGAGLRRRRVLRAQRQGLPAGGGDRRRQSLRAATAMRSTGSARARQLGVLPAPRDSDAAGGAVQRAVLAQARCRPPVHGVRHADHRRRARSGATASIRR